MTKLRPYIYIIIGIFFALLLVKSCSKQAIGMLGGYTEKLTKVEIDTTYLPITIDTIAIFNQFVETKGINLNPKPIIKYIYKDTIKYVIIDSTKTYNVKIKDSLIDGIFKVTNDFEGNLLKSDFKYKPLFPKYIEKTIPIKVTQTITNNISNDKMMLGLGLGINSESHVKATFDVLTKKKYVYSLELINPNLLDKNSVIQEPIIGLSFKKFF